MVILSITIFHKSRFLPVCISMMQQPAQPQLGHGKVPAHNSIERIQRCVNNILCSKLFKIPVDCRNSISIITGSRYFTMTT